NPPPNCGSPNTGRPPHGYIIDWGKYTADIKKQLEYTACCRRRTNAQSLVFDVYLSLQGDKRCPHNGYVVKGYRVDCKKAKDAGHEIKVGRFPFVGNGKAIALGEPEGVIKTIFDAKTGELLGAHMLGAEVTELIQGFVIAMGLETTEEDLMHTVFPHPTLSEMMHESVLDAYGRVIHF
ncbi:MAG: hypothetical protein R3245_07060, partial [Kiloniellales bacterium]|nr:hypothetical protein [Kiloniellales bacterium]